MGTQLLRAGMPVTTTPEAWLLAHPERVRAVHQGFADAGADCFLMCTFMAHPAALEGSPGAGSLEAVWCRAVEVARDVAGDERYVLGSLGPLSRNPREPVDEAVCLRLARAIRSAGGIDGLLLETQFGSGVLPLVRRLLELLSSPAIPLLLSFTYRHEADGSCATITGETPEEVVALVAAEPIAALGVNCGRNVSPGDVTRILRSYRAVTGMPLLARPNAGSPDPAAPEEFVGLEPAAFAAAVGDWLEAGATLVGGCCGTTPAHIRALGEQIWRHRHQ